MVASLFQRAKVRAEVITHFVRRQLFIFALLLFLDLYLFTDTIRSGAISCKMLCVLMALP
jgi:hypothetical protein